MSSAIPALDFSGAFQPKTFCDSAYETCPATAGSGIPSAPAGLIENWDLHIRPETTGLQILGISRTAGREEFCLGAQSSKIVPCSTLLLRNFLWVSHPAFILFLHHTYFFNSRLNSFVLSVLNRTYHTLHKTSRSSPDM